MQNPEPDRVEIERAITLFTQPGKLTELRALNFAGDIVGDGKNFYSDPKELANAVFAIASRPDIQAVWISLNEVSSAFNPAKANQNNSRIRRADISNIRSILLDFDPVRPSGTSATDEQKNNALDAALAAHATLVELGINPVTIDSGNGGHLHIFVNFPNADAADTLIKNFTTVASELFCTPEVTVDLKVGRPEYVAKMPGTVARKGAQPRLARILDVPTNLERLDRERLECLTDLLLVKIPEEKRVGIITEPYAGNDHATAEHVEKSLAELKEFLKHGHVSWSRQKTDSLGAGYVHMLLMDRPFGDHGNTGNTEAWAGVNECGQKRFKCTHNTCHDRGWKDFRALLEGRHGSFSFAPPPDDPNEYHFAAKKKNTDLPDFLRRNLLWNGIVDSFSPFILTDAFGNYLTFDSRAAAMAALRADLLKEYDGNADVVDVPVLVDRLLTNHKPWQTSSSVLGMEVDEKVELTERGNALRLLRARGRVIRYLPGTGWMGRGRSFWFVDVADSNVREQMDHVLQHADFKGAAKAVAIWRKRCQTSSNLNASISRANALLQFRAVRSDFDNDTLMCNLRNCVLRFDKNTGAKRVSDHSFDDMTTFAMPVDYDPNATCEKFEAFMRWMLPDEEQRVYVQTYIGLCLTGLKTRAFLTFVGVGRNGKSVLNKVLAGLFGTVTEQGRPSNSYYLTCNMSTLTSADEKAGEARADLVRLDAARVIAVSESNKSNPKTPVKFNMAFLKNWTGDDPASPARGLYEAKMQDCRTYGKFFIFTNCLPEVSENTPAAWERIKIVECKSVVALENEDPQLHEKLLQE